MVSIYTNGRGRSRLDTPPVFDFREGRKEEEEEPSFEGPWQETQHKVGASELQLWGFEAVLNPSKSWQGRVRTEDLRTQEGLASEMRRLGRVLRNHQFMSSCGASSPWAHISIHPRACLHSIFVK